MAALEISWTAADSSSAAEATSSALLVMSVELRSSSAMVWSSPDAVCDWLSAAVCWSTVRRASSEAADCSSAAAAMLSDPFCASRAARSASTAAAAISPAPFARTCMSLRICSIWPVTVWPFSTSPFAAVAAVLMPWAMTLTSLWICPTRS